MARPKKNQKSTSSPTKTVSSSQSPKKNKKRKYEPQNYKRYLFKILRQVHPERKGNKIGINHFAITTLNDMMIDIYERIVRDAAALCHRDKQHTLSSRHMQTAVRFNFPGELAKHAVNEGTKAVEKYYKSKTNK